MYGLVLGLGGKILWTPHIAAAYCPVNTKTVFGWIFGFALIDLNFFLLFFFHLANGGCNSLVFTTV